MRQKGAFDLAPVRAGGLGYDKQTGARVGGKLAAAPDCASRELRLRVGGGVELNHCGWLCFGRLAPLPPCVEKLPLNRQNAIKTREKQRRTRCRLCLKQRHQFEWQAAWAEQAAGAAELVESRKPTAESRRVLLPTGASWRAKELRCMGTKQTVRLHRKRRQAVARTFEQRGQRAILSGDSGPKSLFLLGIEQQATVGASLLPGVADKALPVENVGRWPGGQPFGLAGAMEALSKGTRGAVAGRDHQAAFAQPSVDLSRCKIPHSSFIRRPGRSLP